MLQNQVFSKKIGFFTKNFLLVHDLKKFSDEGKRILVWCCTCMCILQIKLFRCNNLYKLLVSICSVLIGSQV
uniref:Uncharacterized protein n=1 Tax=Octopus bimaculoides TaxID=37653 RepID=A0A0L8GYI1_OCTBM